MEFWNENVLACVKLKASLVLQINGHDYLEFERKASLVEIKLERNARKLCFNNKTVQKVLSM